MSLVRTISAATLVFSMCVPLADAVEWPHYAGDSARTATAPRATRDLDTIRWSTTPGSDEEYVWRSGPAVHGGRVFVNARRFVNDVHEGNLVIAYDLAEGTRLWATPIEIDIYDSWASPAVDVRNQTVLLGSGQTLYALDTASGAVAWQTPLDLLIVNSSPAVSTDLLDDGAPANRAFIADYDDAGSSAKLYGINVDPFEAAHNPYEPGEIVWSVSLPGSGGNTPAYANGVVYAASTEGIVKAVDALDGSLVRETDVELSGSPQYSSFYGGVCARNGYVYAASYVFYGSGNNSGLFKLDAATGEIEWVAPCERTESIPIVTDDGRICLSAGIQFGESVVKIQAFQDNGGSVTALWDTHVDTGGELVVGGWTHQPAYARGYLYAGTPNDDGTSFFGPYTDLYILDTATTPGAPDFIVAHHVGAGGSPAIADGTVYSFGQAGLLAFDPSPACLADLDGDGTVGLSDLATLLAAYGTSRGDADFNSDADLNRDGTVDLSDLAGVLAVYGEACP
ncbi:MAG: PQQ-binding-like beta-propeller repeat protein [Phycisphaerae bacterium]